MNFYVIIAIVAIAAAVGISYLTRAVKRKIRSAKSLITSTLLQEGMNLQQEMIEETPKSVSGMTRLCLPRITADFPDFDYDYFRRLAENTIKNIVMALSSGSLSKLDYAADSLRDQVSLLAKESERTECSNVKVHRTEISRYDKRGALSVITFQSAFEYKSGGIKVQKKYDLELAFMQDEEKADALGSGASVAGNCPNCGAPLKPGSRSCEYCSSNVSDVNIRSWRFIGFTDLS